MSGKDYSGLVGDSQLTHQIIGAAIEVHKELGPGLLESAYEACLAREMEIRGIAFKRQVPLPVVYKDLKLDCGYRMDIVVKDEIVVEIKSIEAIEDIHEAQCLTYLKFSGKKLCLLLNFNVLLMKDGVRRFVL